MKVLLTASLPYNHQFYLHSINIIPENVLAVKLAIYNSISVCLCVKRTGRGINFNKENSSPEIRYHKKNEHHIFHAGINDFHLLQLES